MRAAARTTAAQEMNFMKRGDEAGVGKRGVENKEQ